MSQNTSLGVMLVPCKHWDVKTNFTKQHFGYRHKQQYSNVNVGGVDKERADARVRQFANVRAERHAEYDGRGDDAAVRVRGAPRGAVRQRVRRQSAGSARCRA